MKKINIAELLKDCPKGMELDCTMFEDVTFRCVKTLRCQFPIEILVDGKHTKYLTKEGCYHDTTLQPKAKCVIFPKGKTTWEGFQRPFKDGDIVALGSVGSAQIFIFKEYIDAKKGLARCYVMLDNDGETDFEGGSYYVERLATEEEKQKLFKAIKDNGYKWNYETKTFVKLIEPKFKVGDKVRHKNNHNVVFTITSIEEDYYACGVATAFWFDDQDNYELVPNKFNINTLKPFDKVLVRDTYRQIWIADFFSHIVEEQFGGYRFACIGHYWHQCIPYKGNEHLLGTNNDCDEFYKTWE